MPRRRLRRTVTLIATLGLAALAAWLRIQEPHGPRPGKTTPRSPAAPKQSAAWIELTSPSLVGDPGDDGDSFLIRHNGGTHVFRLYFVDCPEKKRHQHNRDRLADQGAAFGGLSESDTLRLGREARDFTLALLRDRPFRVWTRWEPVFDDRRHYAHVVITDPDGTQHPLAKRLVDAGLARIHTKGIDLPDGTRRGIYEHTLRSIERSARLAGRGGWAEFALQNTSRDP